MTQVVQRYISLCQVDISDSDDKVWKKSCCKPGIVAPLIKRIADKRATPNVPYKLCLDLKKLNPGGKYGDVDCFGFESVPTFSQRQARLQKEVDAIKTVKEKISLTNETLEDKVWFKQHLKLITEILSLRGKDLRDVMRKREYAFESI